MNIRYPLYEGVYRILTTILRSAHKMETTGRERKTARLKTEKDKHPGHGNTPSEPHPGFI